MLHPWLVLTTNPTNTAQDLRCFQLQPCPGNALGCTPIVEGSPAAKLGQSPPSPAPLWGHVPIGAGSPPPVLAAGLILTPRRGRNALLLLRVSWCSFGFTLTNALCLEVLFGLGLYSQPGFQPGHKQPLGPTGGRISIRDRTRLPAALWAAWKGKSIDLL